MVSLTGPNGQDARPVGERGSARVGRRYHRQYGVRFGRRREEMKGEPTNLLQLEELARRSVELMEKWNPKSDKNYFVVMDLLRQQYNLNFMILCDKCGTPHDNDEILAPER